MASHPSRRLSLSRLLPSACCRVSVLSVLLLALLGCCLPSASSALRPNWRPPFPVVPSSYDSHVSLFFPLSSFSLLYRDYYSSNASLLRRDHHFMRGDLTEYVAFQQRQQPAVDAAVALVNTTSGACGLYSLPAAQSEHLYYQPSSSILRLLSSVSFGWQYVGQTRATRNVTAYQWRLSNATVTPDGALCLYNASHPDGEQCAEPSATQRSFSQLIDQTADLSSNVSYWYTNVTVDYYVKVQPVLGLDGSVPLRVVLSGHRSNSTSATNFTHYFDWLQFKPLDPADLSIDTAHCLPSGKYNPAVPRSVPPPSHVLPPRYPTSLPKLPTSFAMLVEEQTSLADERTNRQDYTASGAVLWTRQSDVMESTQYLDSSTPYSALTASLSSSTLYYNYSSRLVWSVNQSSCGVQRVTPLNANLLATPIPVSFLALFRASSWPNLPMSLSYRLAGWREVRGVQCMHYVVLNEVKFADIKNFWRYNSSILLAPPSWQHPDSALYQLPIQMSNAGSDFQYTDKPDRDKDKDKDKDKDREGDKDRDEDRDIDRRDHRQHDEEEESKDREDDEYRNSDGKDDDEKDHDEDDRGDNKAACNSSAVQVTGKPSIPAPVPCPNSTKEVGPPHPPAELPSQRSFSEVWDVFSLSTPVPAHAFDIEMLGCHTKLPQPFPPMPSGYSTSVVVSSSLTSEVYAYTEYFDLFFGQRVDGRFHGRDTIEVTKMNGLSVLYDNPLADEAAYGYGSRVDYSTHPMLASYMPTMDGQETSTCIKQGWFNMTQLPTQQFVSAVYYYYLQQYPPSTWSHADPSTLDGMLVDQWQAINQTTTVDGDLIFNTAIFYFSHPETLYDVQVPLRFEVSKVMIATSSDESQTVLESTVVEFVQWNTLECSLIACMALFGVPPVHNCSIDTYETRYEKLLSALAAPARPAEYTALPAIPTSFTAVILTQLDPSSSQLHALRWYVDEEEDRDRLDWAPVNSHAAFYHADHHSTIYQHEDDWGAYQLNTTGCTALNMSTTESTNPLLLHHSGTLPAFFTGSFDDATVLQTDKVNGVDVICFQKQYVAVYNRYSNRTSSFTRQACFTQSNWVLYPSGQQQQLTAVDDTGSYTYWSNDTQSLQSVDFTVSYDIVFLEATPPSPALFNLTHHHCDASGITHVDPDDPSDNDGSGDGQAAMALLSTTEVLGLSVLAGVVVTALAYTFKRSWQRRHRRSLDDSDSLQEPLSSLSTSESCRALSSSALTASLSDSVMDDAELEDVNDGYVTKPALIL